MICVQTVDTLRYLSGKLNSESTVTLTEEHCDLSKIMVIHVHIWAQFNLGFLFCQQMDEDDDEDEDDEGEDDEESDTNDDELDTDMMDDRDSADDASNCK